jgi:hypothetical protein
MIQRLVLRFRMFLKKNTLFALIHTHTLTHSQTHRSTKKCKLANILLFNIELVEYVAVVNNNKNAFVVLLHFTKIRTYNSLSLEK